MKVSACIIAKNEEKNLPRLLKSLAGKFDEIVLVDTGSTDKTKEIAREYGCRVYEIPWSGFADARNAAVREAKGDWIWFFDADMELTEEGYEKFKRILSIVDSDKNIDGITVVYRNLLPDGRLLSLSSTTHIHRNSPDLFWVGKVHERISHRHKEQVVIPHFSVTVNHYGYGVAPLQNVKAKRNLALLNEELKGLKKGSLEYLIKLFYIAQSYAALSSVEEAEQNLQKALKAVDEFFDAALHSSLPVSSVFYLHMHVYAAAALLGLDRLEQAQEYLKRGLDLEPGYPDLLYLMAKVLEKEGKKEAALSYYIKFIISADKAQNNPKIISDYIAKTREVIDEIAKWDPPLDEKKSCMLQDEWKKSRGANLGLLLYRVMQKDENKRSFSFLQKLYRLYRDSNLAYEMGKRVACEDPFRAILYLREALELEPSNMSARKLLGELLFLQKNDQEAWEHLMGYLQKTGDFSVVPRLRQIASNLGFEEEAERLEKIFGEKMKEISKSG